MSKIKDSLLELEQDFDDTEFALTPLSELVTDEVLKRNLSPDLYTDEFGPLQVDPKEVEATAEYLLDLYVSEELKDLASDETCKESINQVAERLRKVAEQNLPSAEEWAELADDGSESNPHLA